VAKGSQGFSKAHRITRRKEFERIYTEGLLLKNDYFRIYALAKDDPIPRLGLAVTTKLGKAVVRNRLKRHIREWFRKNKDEFRGFDLIIQPKPPAAGLRPQDIYENLCELSSALKR